MNPLKVPPIPSIGWLPNKVLAIIGLTILELPKSENEIFPYGGFCPYGNPTLIPRTPNVPLNVMFNARALLVPMPPNDLKGKIN